jgi:hypothetical protein
MDSLEFHQDPSSLTLLRPAGGPTLKRPSSTPLDTPRHTPMGGGAMVVTGEGGESSRGGGVGGSDRVCCWGQKVSEKVVGMVIYGLVR